VRRAVVSLLVLSLPLSLVACGEGSSDGTWSAYPGNSSATSSTSVPEVDPDELMRSNTAYRDFPPASPEFQAIAGPYRDAVATALEAVRASPPVTEASVRAKLTEAVPDGDVGVSTQAARIPEGVGYGIFVERDRAFGCIHGWVSERGSDVEIDGVGSEGCLPLLGH